MGRAELIHNGTYFVVRSTTLRHIPQIARATLSASPLRGIFNGSFKIGAEKEPIMGLFDGKKGLILGVANGDSIAWAIAQRVMAEGGLCGFSHLPDRSDDERQRNRRRVSQLTDNQPNAKLLVPLDVSKDEQITAIMEKAAAEFGKIDFLLHSIAFATIDDLKRPTIETSRDGFKLAMEISAYSLLALCNAAK